MHRVSNTVRLLPGIHPVGNSAHGPQDTCRGWFLRHREAQDGAQMPSSGGLVAEAECGMQKEVAVGGTQEGCWNRNKLEEAFLTR